MNKKDSGLTVVPIIIGLLISVAVIAFLATKVMNNSREEKKEFRRIAIEMSDYGFQEMTMRLESMSDLANEDFVSIESTEVDNGWYKLNVQKNVIHDTMVVIIESVGGAGTERVSQERQFKLINTEVDTIPYWVPLQWLNEKIIIVL